MIKCDGFGKLLKPLFSILLIGFFGLLGGFSSSEWVIRQNGNYLPSTLDSSINLNVVNKGQLMSERFGYTQRMLAFFSSDNNRLFFWWSLNGKPYYYITYNGGQSLGIVNYQGFLNYYYLCDELFLTGGGMTNCVLHSINDDFSTEIGGLFQSMTINDLRGYDIHTWSCYNSTNQLINQLCFSSSQYGKSICFSAGYGNTSVCSCTDCGNLSNSLGIPFNKDFTSISDNYVSTPPGFSYGGESNGSLNVDSSSVITGDYTYSTCTVGQVLDELESNGYTSYVCYGGLDNFNDWDSSQTYNIIPGSGLRLSQILSYSSVWSTPQEWFDYWNGLYFDDKFNAMWESYPAVYHTWFDLYYRYTPNKYFDYVREYCNMKVDLNLDLNSVYKGQYFKGVCDTIIDKQIYNYGNTTSGGEVLQGVNRGFNSGQSVNNSIDFIQKYFNLLKSKINLDYSNLIFGFLPKYIIGFLLALILFRFLSH